MSKEIDVCMAEPTVRHGNGSRPLKSTGQHCPFLNLTGRQGAFLKSTGDMEILGTNDMAFNIGPKIDSGMDKTNSDN